MQLSVLWAALGDTSIPPLTFAGLASFVQHCAIWLEGAVFAPGGTAFGFVHIVYFYILPLVAMFCFGLPQPESKRFLPQPSESQNFLSPPVSP